MPNASTPPPQPQGGVVFDFGFIPFEYWIAIFGLILVMVVGIGMFYFRGIPMKIAKANFFKKDLLLINLGNDRLIIAIPTVVADWYHIKSGKKKGGLGGYFHITAKSIMRFGNTGLAYVNAHQAMTIPLTTTEVMTNLQNEELLGLRVDSYSDIDVIVKYGELLNRQEEAKAKGKKVKEIDEDLELKFAGVVERMRNLDHLTPLTEPLPDPKPGDKRPPRIFTKKDVEGLKKLIAQSKVKGSELLKGISKEDLALLTKAQGQMIRGQTSALRSIRGFLDGRLKVPHPRVEENLVEDAIQRMTKAQDTMRIMMYAMVGIIMAGIITAALLMFVISS